MKTAKKGINGAGKPDPQFFDFSYTELLTKYRQFGYSIPSGGTRSGTVTDRVLLLDLEREIQRREKSGETGEIATLKIGGESVRVMTRSERKSDFEGLLK